MPLEPSCPRKRASNRSHKIEKAVILVKESVNGFPLKAGMTDFEGMTDFYGDDGSFMGMTELVGMTNLYGDDGSGGFASKKHTFSD